MLANKFSRFYNNFANDVYMKFFSLIYRNKGYFYKQIDDGDTTPPV